MFAVCHVDRLPSVLVRTVLHRIFTAARAAALSMLLLCLGSWGIKAHAQAEFRVLSDPALTARNPDRDFIEAITRAGNRLVAVGEHGIIIYSDDNGQSWKQAAVPVDVTLTTVAFATPRNGWAGGALGVVLHSTDGGLMWKTQITGIQVNQLVAAAATQFAASRPTDPMAERAVRRADIFMQAGPDKPFLSIVPFDSNNVQIFGAYRLCIKTKNSGESWQDCSLDVPDPISHNLYKAVRSGPSVYVAGESGSVFLSTDFGQTFSQLAAPAEDTLLGILVTPARTLLSFGVAGGLFRSTDQGRTWSTQANPSQSDLTTGIVLKSGNILIMSEAGAIYLSADDGLSFRALQVNEGMGLFGAVQAQNGDVVLVGSGGVRVLSLTDLN